MPPPWYSVKDAMAEPDPTYTPTIDGNYQILQAPPRFEGGQRAYYEQRRRAIITELRALDKLLGRKQTIPRKER